MSISTPEDRKVQPTICRRKTYYNYQNTGYRGNFEVPPKDAKPAYFSTEGGFFYRRPNVNQQVNPSSEPARVQILKRSSF